MCVCYWHRLRISGKELMKHKTAHARTKKIKRGKNTLLGFEQIHIFAIRML
jgi:hypothetical protein